MPTWQPSPKEPPICCNSRSIRPMSRWSGGHAGPAYGVPHAATIDAMNLGARLEALVLDPVYSGKGLAGLIALIEAGR